jgi:hypothetical protein
VSQLLVELSMGPRKLCNGVGHTFTLILLKSNGVGLEQLIICKVVSHVVKLIRKAGPRNEVYYTVCTPCMHRR